MTDRYKTSRALLERARRTLAGGVSSPFRASFPVPLYFEDGCGCRLRDVDGNEYIDYTLAWGPNILGYRHPRIVEAVSRAAQGVHSYGAQHALEPEVAEKFCRAVPCAERVAFTSSGSEAVQCALRLARAFAGRTLIVKFEGHYHGWMDSVLLSYRTPAANMGPVEEPLTALNSRGQVANAAGNVIAAPWNDLDCLERIFARRGQEIAAVITEPVLCNSGGLMPEAGYLEGLRALTTRYGALLIFDEVITGFRMALGGAQQFFNVIPDLAVFGKAAAAGLPFSAIAGRAAILDELYNGVAFGGTFNGNPVVLAAAAAALDVLSQNGGALLAHANRLGERLMSGLAEIAAAHRIPLQIRGFGAAFGVHFTNRTVLRQYRDTFEDDKERLTSYIRAMLDLGVYLLPDGRVYTSCAHTRDDIDRTLAAAEQALAGLA